MATQQEINAYVFYEVLRKKLINDLSTQTKEQVSQALKDADFTPQQLQILYDYCIQHETYEVCEVIKPLV